MRLHPQRTLVALAYMLATLALTAAPGRWVGRLGVSPGLLNWLHVPLFAGLAWVTLSAVLGPALPRVLVAGGACLAFAAADELLQAWVPDRVPELRDFVANTGGIVLGTACREGWRPALSAVCAAWGCRGRS